MHESVTEMWLGGVIQYDQDNQGEGHAGYGVQGTFMEVVGGVDEHREAEHSTVGKIRKLEVEFINLIFARISLVGNGVGYVMNSNYKMKHADQIGLNSRISH